MPYNPSVNDTSGQILGAAINQAGGNLGQGIEQMAQMQKQVDIDAKAYQSLAKSHPELVGNVDVQGMSKKQMARAFRGLAQAADIGMKAAQMQMEQGRANYYNSRGAGYDELALQRKESAIRGMVENGILSPEQAKPLYQKVYQEMGGFGNISQPAAPQQASNPLVAAQIQQNRQQAQSGPFSDLAMLYNNMTPIQQKQFESDTNDYRSLAQELQKSMPNYSPNFIGRPSQTNKDFDPQKVKAITTKMSALQKKNANMLPVAMQLQDLSNQPAQKRPGAFGAGAPILTGVTQGATQ